MLRLLWRGFVSRKVRVALTALAVAIGVTLMAGTYILTDTINAAFSNIFATANSGSSVVVTPHSALGTNNAAQTSPITDHTVDTVRSVSGVASASGGIFEQATLFNSKGTRINTAAPSFVSGLEPKPFESFSPIQGRFPTGDGQVAIDQATASRYSLGVGDRLKVAGSGVARTYQIVGVVHFAGSQSFGGSGVALLPMDQAQQVSGYVGRYDEIDVAANPGVTPSQLRQRIRAVLPSSLTVRTGSQQASQESSQLASNLGFLRTFLLIFAYLALFVGAFIIFNTFSITVAQRTRELGLLRALGASRRQLLTSVLGESLLLGLLGSVVGLALGILVAPGLNQLFKLFGADLPDNGTVLEARTVIVSLVVGVVVSVAAGLAPAIRATRVTPVAAMREGVAAEHAGWSRHSLWVSLAVMVLGVLMIVGQLAGHGSGALLGLGALVVFVGVALLSPRLVPVLARGLGVLVTWRGVTGRLARENARRQPGRTAVTAAALMIGLALVTFVSIAAAGVKSSVNQAVHESFAGNLIVENSATNSNQGIPATVAPALRQIHGVHTVTPVSFSEADIRGISGGPFSVTGIQPSTFPKLYKVDWVQGSPRVYSELDDTGTILTKNFANNHNLHVGNSLSLTTPTGRHVQLKVLGIVTDNAQLFGSLTASRSLLQTSFGQLDDAVDFVGYAHGATDGQVQPAVNRMLRAQFPQAESQTAAQFVQTQAGQVNSLLALIYVLLALAVIVSLFGIVNTLVLSIYERRRELGMLRAIGLERRQVRQMVRYESVITSMIGGVIGLVVGIVFALLISKSLIGSAFVLTIPVGTLIILLVLAAVAGIVAAIGPARRAARLDVLAAIASD